MVRIKTAVLVLCVVAGFLALMKAAGGQHNHAEHHNSYRNWINQASEGCCNDQDCRTLAESDERATGGVLEVRIEGEWCPVLPKHYLKSGNVPDASTAHVCAWLPNAKPGLTPCERLLCYQPRPLS